MCLFICLFIGGYYGDFIGDLSFLGKEIYENKVMTMIKH